MKKWLSYLAGIGMVQLIVANTAYAWFFLGWVARWALLRIAAAVLTAVAAPAVFITATLFTVGSFVLVGVAFDVVEGAVAKLETEVEKIEERSDGTKKVVGTTPIEVRIVRKEVPITGPGNNSRIDCRIRITGPNGEELTPDQWDALASPETQEKVKKMAEMAGEKLGSVSDCAYLWLNRWAEAVNRAQRVDGIVIIPSGRSIFVEEEETWPPLGGGSPQASPSGSGPGNHLATTSSSSTGLAIPDVARVYHEVSFKKMKLTSSSKSDQKQKLTGTILFDLPFFSSGETFKSAGIIFGQKKYVPTDSGVDQIPNTRPLTFLVLDTLGFTTTIDVDVAIDSDTGLITMTFDNAAKIFEDYLETVVGQSNYLDYAGVPQARHDQTVTLSGRCNMMDDRFFLPMDLGQMQPSQLGDLVVSKITMAISQIDEQIFRAAYPEWHALCDR